MSWTALHVLQELVYPELLVQSLFVNPPVWVAQHTLRNVEYIVQLQGDHHVLTCIACTVCD